MNRTISYEIRINDEMFNNFSTLREARAYVKTAEFLEQATQTYGQTFGVQIVSVTTTLKELTFFTVDGSEVENQDSQIIEGDNNIQVNGDLYIDSDSGYENA